MTNLEKKLRNIKEKSNHRQYKMSAVVLYKGRPISFGFNNQLKTHPFVFRYNKDKTIHAEVAALLKVKDKDILKKCSIMVFREDKQGNPALAKPCYVCTEILKDYGIKTVIYTTPEGWLEEKW